MDRGLRAALVTAILALSLAPAAGAQGEDGQSAQPSTQGGTAIFGAQELPKGLTLVPWKKSEPGELTAEPTRLVDEPLVPIDPEAFERRLEYYEQNR